MAAGAGLVVTCAYVLTYDIGGDGQLFLLLGLFSAMIGVCGLLFLWTSWPGAGLVAAFLLFASMAPTLLALENAVLDMHGRTGVCQVLDVVKDTRQEYVPGTGDTPGRWETRTVYLHSLRCPPGGPDRLTADRRLAFRGDALKVVWDPGGRVGPVPASDRVDPKTVGTASFVMLAIALLILWIEAFVDLIYYPALSGRDGGVCFMSLAEAPSRRRHERKHSGR